MTHVLLDRNLAAADRLRGQLNRWGMTSAWFDPQEDGACWPGILDGDLVLVAADAAGCPAPHPSDPMAPVILLGVSGPVLLARNAWQGLPQAEPDVETLRRAVQQALAQGAILRQGFATDEEQEDFLAYLGHELRSPLTAARTSLEVLTDALADLDDGGSQAEARQRMAEIAGRNLIRLQQTLEWNHDLMVSSLEVGQVQIRKTEAAELEVVLDQHFALQVDPAARECTALTDPVALVPLLRQLGRALVAERPGASVQLRLERLAGLEGALQLSLTPCSAVERSGAPRVSTLGLVRHDGPGQEPEKTLAGLVRQLVSSPLLACLGGELEVRAGKVVLALPSVEGPSVPVAQEASLRRWA